MMSHVVALEFSCPSNSLSPSHASSGTISTFFDNGRKLPQPDNNNQQRMGRRKVAGHCQEALEPPAFWLPFVGILRRCLMTFDAADRFFSTVSFFLPAVRFIFFSPTFRFLILSSVCQILFPSYLPYPAPFVCFFGGRHVARLMCRKDM